MRKLEQDELVPAIQDRDKGKFMPYQYEQLAVALKQELDITLLRSQEAGSIQRLMNLQTRQQERKDAVDFAPQQSSVRPINPPEGQPISLPEDPFAEPEETPQTPDVPVSVPAEPVTKTAPTGPETTSETPSAMAA